MPGDIGGKPVTTERRPIQNLNDFVKTDTQMTNPTSTAVGQTEHLSNQEEFEDEMEEGGLC